MKSAEQINYLRPAPDLQFAFGARYLTSDSRVALAGEVGGFGESFKKCFDDVVRFGTVEEFEMEVAAGFIREALEEFAGQSEAESGRHILRFFSIRNLFEGEFVEAAPDQVRPAAEIDHTAGEAFVHRDVGFAADAAFLGGRIETGAVAAEARFIAESLMESLPERDAAILHGVMGIDFEIAIAFELEICDRMLGEESQHVIEERNPGGNRRFSGAIDIQLQNDAGFLGGAVDPRGALRHGGSVTIEA